MYAQVVREPTYFLLAALLDGPLHGYAIAQRAGELSDGRVKLSAGTLYGALERLTAEGLVEEHAEDVVAGRRRRYHRLTGAGQAALAEEARRLDAAAAAVRERLPLAPAEARA
jgi:DNA-binding PadR family transcriptional regulator